MVEPERHPMAAELIAAVGEVMLRWGRLEAEMMRRLEGSEHKLSPRAPTIQLWRVVSGQPGSDLAVWNEEIEWAAHVRNLLAHGFVGGVCEPIDGHPAVICRHPDGENRRLTYDTLKAAAQRIDLLQLRLRQETDALRRSPRKI